MGRVFILTEEFMKANGKMESLMDEESSSGQMEGDMMENGLMENPLA